MIKNKKMILETIKFLLREFAVSGECKGRILFEPTGSGGFGYDPVFFSDDLGKPFGLASSEEKDEVSHRGRAVGMLKKKLKEIFGKEHI